MLNRTLSANLNGLNLGTRTLAIDLAGLNIVAQLRHDHPQKRKGSMRDAYAKMMEGLSISDSDSIRGPLPISSFASSPQGFRSWPFCGRPSPARSEVVEVAVAEASVPVQWTGRASMTAWPQVLAEPQACGRRRASMTRAESIPAASTAAGG
jgi:hypothetical protein